jgi:O-methyltransferase
MIYYVYTILFDKDYQPKQWKYAKKYGIISKKLLKAERNYPDKVRFFNFWFQVERLKHENIAGAFAELGVYKGNSAYILHLMDAEREFHLFDTFEGFSNRDLKIETGKAATYTTANFADINMQKTKKRLSSNKFIFHKGYFPESTDEINDKTFALVNLDADLYNPTKAGLEYFYERLAPGGLIIVHDYNEEWPGILKAVNNFVKKHNLITVPVPDVDNSIMLFKEKC